MSPMLKACRSPVCDLDWQSRNGPETIGQRGKGAGKGSDGRVVDACGGAPLGALEDSVLHKVSKPILPLLLIAAASVHRQPAPRHRRVAPHMHHPQAVTKSVKRYIIVIVHYLYLFT